MNIWIDSVEDGSWGDAQISAIQELSHDFAVVGDRIGEFLCSVAQACGEEAGTNGCPIAAYVFAQLALCRKMNPDSLHGIGHEIHEIVTRCLDMMVAGASRTFGVVSTTEH